MKVKDIVEYGMMDEPGGGASRASTRQATAKVVQTNKRITNKNSRSNTNANLANAQAARSQKRKTVSPTGIPARLLAPGS
jgi:hypothetical protein